MQNLILSCLLLIAFTLSGQSPTEDLNSLLKDAYANSSIPGFAVAIVNKDQILYKNAFGYEDLSTQKPYTLESSHNIGSTTKTFIGIAIMQLVEAGKLELDVDINTYLPFETINPNHPESAITLRHLATHTATIRDRTRTYDLRAYISDDNAPGNRKGLPLIYKIHFKRMLKSKNIPLGDFLEKTLSKEGAWFQKKSFHKDLPGAAYHYSNIGAALAAYIVEIVSGEKYADYVKQHILAPLQLEQSGWAINMASQKHFTKRYIGDKPTPDYQLITYPDGGLYSNTKDLSTYLIAMMKGYYGESDFLSSSSFSLLMKNQIVPLSGPNSADSIEEQSGIFWDIFGASEDGDIGHSGSDPGIVSFLYFNPKEGLGCVFLTNIDSHKNFEELLNIWQLLIKHKRDFKS